MPVDTLARGDRYSSLKCLLRNVVGRSIFVCKKQFVVGPSAAIRHLSIRTRCKRVGVCWVIDKIRKGLLGRHLCTANCSFASIGRGLFSQRGSQSKLGIPDKVKRRNRQRGPAISRLSGSARPSRLYLYSRTSPAFSTTKFSRKPSPHHS